MTDREKIKALEINDIRDEMWLAIKTIGESLQKRPKAIIRFKSPREAKRFMKKLRKGDIEITGMGVKMQ